MKKLNTLSIKSTMKKLNRSNVLFMVCLCFLTACGYSIDQTRLFVAVSNEKAEEVRELVKSDNVDINSQNNGLGTFLTMAAYMGNVEIIEILLDNGARINQTSFNGLTPLMNAVISRNPAAVKLLVERGADISLETRRKEGGVTAKSLAEVIGNHEIIDILESAAKAEKQESR